MIDSVKKWTEGLNVAGCPDEFESKEVLKLFGIETPQGVRIAADDATNKIKFSAPYTAKVCSPQILHKTEHDGVILDIAEQSLSNAITELRERFPGKAVLVEEYIRFEPIEFIVGAMVDPNFGPAVMVGAGGVLTELYRDVAFRLAPCSPAEAGCMLKELTLAPVLSDFRGINLDHAGLAKIITAVADISLELGEFFGQLDINPIVFSEGRWVALDVQLVLSNCLDFEI